VILKAIVLSIVLESVEVGLRYEKLILNICTFLLMSKKMEGC
jgi:hypothetical protein